MKRRNSEKKCANPLFLKWLTEWRDEAVQQKRESLKQCLTKAIKSLKEHPDHLPTGAHCETLKYFGPKVCSMLDKRLEQYLRDELPDEGDVAKKAKTNANQKKRKVYIPKPGSGGYAILLTLYRESKKPGAKDFMTKAELQTKAQPLCNASLKKAQAGTFYTAWNSMTTLKERELVIGWSNPAKFRLSEKGVEMAEAIERADRNGQNVGGNAKNANSSVDISYLLSSDDEEFGIDSPKRQTFSSSDYAFDDVPSTSKKGFPSTSKNGIPSTSRNGIPSTLKNEIPSTSKNGIPSTSKNGIPSTSRNGFSSEPYKFSNFASSSYAFEDIPSTSKNPPIGFEFTSSAANDEFASSPKKPTFYLEPHTFDILLIVDNQETTGKANQKEDATYAELQNLKVKFEVRHLHIGDYLWIARCRETKKELVLPHIIERKRIDDLAESIQDRRYYKQKAVLKKCGIKNRIYLIESYAKNLTFSIDYDALLQAATNTLVQDGFIVKFTDSHKDTMSYLSKLTSSLRNAYQDKRLSSCDIEDVNSLSQVGDSEPLLEFEQFNKNALKLKTTSKVRDMFLCQLIQIKGVSADKAAAIVEVFPTPKLLYTALNNPENNGETLLEYLQCGLTKRQLGPIASKTIYQLYTQRNLS